MDETTRVDGAVEPASRSKRKRTGRKRTVFQPPARPAPAVRELWKQAGLEERKRAHEACVLILEYWLGKKSKREVAQTLGVAPLRVWQLSQQAVSGMLAGLLKQPRRRRKAAELALLAPEEDPRLLKKRIRELETRLARTEDLVRVLRTAPWAAKTSEGEDGGGAKRTTATRRARASKAHRAAAPESSARCSRDGGAGESGRTE